MNRRLARAAGERLHFVTGVEVEVDLITIVVTRTIHRDPAISGRMPFDRCGSSWNRVPIGIHGGTKVLRKPHLVSDLNRVVGVVVHGDAFTAAIFFDGLGIIVRGKGICAALLLLAALECQAEDGKQCVKSHAFK